MSSSPHIKIYLPFAKSFALDILYPTSTCSAKLTKPTFLFLRLYFSKKESVPSVEALLHTQKLISFALRFT